MRSDLYVKSVLEKCKSLKRAGAWAGEPKIRPQAWLLNFEEAERPIAAILLDHFVFASAVAVDRMLLSGYRSLRDRIIRTEGKEQAKAILDSAVFTAVEGEHPNLTDSGNLFCRKLRQLLAIDESRFLLPAEAVLKAAQGHPVIFVDDFVGSGGQFITTWARSYQANFPQSFRDAHDRKPFPVFYLTLIASSEGRRLIAQGAPVANVHATHVLNCEDSVHAMPRSQWLPDVPNIPERIDALLEKYHSRLQLPEYLGSIEERKFGFNQLGFLFAFDHSTPDATLPLIWANGPDNWTPLIRRT